MANNRMERIKEEYKRELASIFRDIKDPRLSMMTSVVAVEITKDLKYAEKNWNNGIGLCADFASKCLQAGGVDVYGETVIDLYNKLNGKYGTSYKLKLTNGTSGKISMSANDGKLEKGDPIFYKCNYCGDFEHVVICTERTCFFICTCHPGCS